MKMNNGETFQSHGMQKSCKFSSAISLQRHFQGQFTHFSILSIYVFPKFLQKIQAKRSYKIRIWADICYECTAFLYYTRGPLGSFAYPDQNKRKIVLKLMSNFICTPIAPKCSNVIFTVNTP